MYTCSSIYTFGAGLQSRTSTLQTRELRDEIIQLSDSDTEDEVICLTPLTEKPGAEAEKVFTEKKPSFIQPARWKFARSG